MHHVEYCLILCVCVLVGTEGVIKGWTEEVLNMSRAVHYNPETGTFKVERSGVYFLYCQVSRLAPVFEN